MLLPSVFDIMVMRNSHRAFVSAIQRIAWNIIDIESLININRPRIYDATCIIRLHIAQQADNAAELAIFKINNFPAFAEILHLSIFSLHSIRYLLFVDAIIAAHTPSLMGRRSIMSEIFLAHHRVRIVLSKFSQPTPSKSGICRH